MVRSPSLLMLASDSIVVGSADRYRQTPLWSVAANLELAVILKICLVGGTSSFHPQRASGRIVSQPEIGLSDRNPLAGERVLHRPPSTRQKNRFAGLDSELAQELHEIRIISPSLPAATSASWIASRQCLRLGCQVRFRIMARRRRKGQFFHPTIALPSIGS